MNSVDVCQDSCSVEVLSGHFPIGIHAVRLKLLSDASYQSSLEEGQLKTHKHFLLDCPGFANQKLNHLGSLTFGEPGD